MFKHLVIFYFIVFLIGGCIASNFTTNHSQHSTDDSLPVWPPPPQKPRIQFVRSISSSQDIDMKKSWFKKTIDYVFGHEESEEKMLRPYAVCADSEKIYVTDPGLFLIHIFDLQEKRYFQIKKVKDLDLISPIGIAVDKNGEIFFSDSVLKRVFVLDKEGKYLREIGSTDLFLRPTGIAIDEDRIYVTDTHGHQILVFSKKNGNLLFRIGRNGTRSGEFNYPTHIFISNKGLIYVTDSLNFRIQIFDRDGNFVTSFGKLGDGSGNFSKPKGIAVDSAGHIYVADSHFDNVQIFDRDGNLLLTFGKTGRGQGEMVLPAGIFIDRQNRIYVADSFNNRIQIFQYLGIEK